MPTERHAVVRRITAEGLWTSLGPVHIGGDATFETSSDMAVARDPRGRFYIPGASQAGATRSFLARVNSGSLDDFAAGAEDHVLDTLYGGHLRPGDKKTPAYASLLTFHEARQEGAAAVFVRDGVAIQSANGNALDEGKYDFEVLPAGTAFRIRIELKIYSDLPRALGVDEVRQWFRWILESFHEDGVRLGAKTRRGLGVGAVKNWTIREFDLQDRAHALDWLASTDRGFTGGKLLSLTDLGKDALAPAPRRLTIDARFKIRTSMLVRGAGGHENAPDAAQFTENGQKIVPGTAIAGVLRHRVERIANTLAGDGEAVCESLFGYANQPKREISERASRVSVREAPLHDGDCHVQSRVAIDRFTGGSLETRLFDEAPFWGKSAAPSHLRVRIAVDDPDRRERRLILLAFKDLWLGDLPLGGESSIGRGVLQGVEAEFHDSSSGGEVPVMTWKRDGGDGRVKTTGAREWAQKLGDM